MVKENSKIIAVDFDGTIYIKGSVSELAKHLIPKWQRQGHKVVLWTCREQNRLQEALHICAEHGIQFDHANSNINTLALIRKYKYDSRKIQYDYIIDDKSPTPVHEQFRLVDKLLEAE